MYMQYSVIKNVCCVYGLTCNGIDEQIHLYEFLLNIRFIFQLPSTVAMLEQNN